MFKSKLLSWRLIAGMFTCIFFLSSLAGGQDINVVSFDVGNGYMAIGYDVPPGPDRPSHISLDIQLSDGAFIGSEADVLVHPLFQPFNVLQDPFGAPFLNYPVSHFSVVLDISVPNCQFDMPPVVPDMIFIRLQDGGSGFTTVNVSPDNVHNGILTCNAAPFPNVFYPPPFVVSLEPEASYEIPSTSDIPGVPCGCTTCDDTGGSSVPAGDTVYLFSGEYHTTVTDLKIAGRGLDFVFTRKYRSKVGPQTAMGHSWDFSYNIRIEQLGPDLLLHDGNSRQDFFSLQPDGSWAADGFFHSIVEDLPGDPSTLYTATFPDTGIWRFLPLNDPAAPGKISAITDRNGNTLVFDYDNNGRLVTIHDPLDTSSHERDITLGYNGDGFISSVTDFTGRSVTYDYYEDGDAGGSAGDLKSVTTPVVTGTATGNDFPGGKTTIYTYSTGFGDENLNHNLLTITDPKGQTYLMNEYATTTNPNDYAYDRIIRQTWGDSLDIIDYTYLPVVPGPENDFSFYRTVVNDRVGNVSEYFFGPSNALTIERDYTGRADPDNPTILPAHPLLVAPFIVPMNEPLNPVRPGDPPFFETRMQYNDDLLVGQLVLPNGNFENYVYEFDLDPNASRQTRGNMREKHTDAGPLSGVSDQALISEFYEYDDGLGGGCCGTNFVARHVDGRGSETLHTYDSRGNRIHTQHRIASIFEDWEYNEFGQVTRHILPDNGSGHRRVDVYDYYSNSCPGDVNGDGLANLDDFGILAFYWMFAGNSIADIFPPGGDLLVGVGDLQVLASDWLTCQGPIVVDPQAGYLRRVIVDDTGFALTRSYEYDAVGNVIRETDPRGNDTLREYNQLDQVVRELSRETSVGSGVRYEKLTYYDGNDNVVRVDVENRDEGGVLQANTHFTTIFEYEILNNRVRDCRESGDYSGVIPGSIDLPICTGLPEPNFITVEYAYDANRNQTLVRSGEASEGRQAANTVTTLYDERDLVFQTIRAAGDLDQSTSQFDYDSNGNVVAATSGLEDTPRATTNQYDGFDRRVRSDDPMGNVTTWHYDENSNRLSEVHDGELDDSAATGLGNLRLSETTYVFDLMDRRTRVIQEFFDATSQTPIDDGTAETVTLYSDNSQVIRVTNDNNHAIETIYDSANRMATQTDAAGNSETYTYDGNSNVISVEERERSDLGGPDEIFATTSVYDGLDRLVSTADNVGNTTQYDYDSRGNRTVETDAENAERRNLYDGINRLVSTIHDLDGDGADGDGDDIVVLRSYDDADRVISQTDANGNTTQYAYDPLNRMIVRTHEDSTQHTFVYDVHDNCIDKTDANGSVTVGAYDLLDRLTGNTVTPGLGVSSDTTFETYTYDGLSRMVTADDDDSTITRTYDSLDRVTSETLNGQTTATIHDGVGNATQCVYPGGRVVTCTFDSLERIKTVSDGGGTIATYDYVGPDRVERRSYGNNTQTDYAYDGVTGVPNAAGDSGVKQIVRTTHTFDPAGAATVIDDRTYQWDRTFNKLQMEDIRSTGPLLTHDYTYDSIYRLTRSVVTDSLAATLLDTAYEHDGAGNRIMVTGSANPGPYGLNPVTPIPADFQVNQYSDTPADARFYDENGNLISTIDTQFILRTYEYDYCNRMVSLSDPNSGITEYAYDALGRRIGRVLDAAGVPDETHYHYDSFDRVCEEQDSGSVTQATYVYGGYVDEVLSMERNAIDYYYHTDDLFTVRVLTDSSGSVIERYAYDDYGRVLDPVLLTPLSGDPSGVGNPYLFTGRRYDPETGWYYYRSRYLDPSAGRFTTRDRLGMWTDGLNLGNGYSYVGNNPHTNVDPQGELSMKLIYAKKLKCGGFNVKWWFYLDKKAPCDGYMVQQVDYKNTIKPCKGKAKTTATTYWESWNVKKGKRLFTLYREIGYSDMAYEPPHKKTCGNARQTGKLKFFCNTTTGDLGRLNRRPKKPNGDWAPGREPMSKSLPSTKTKPTWWDKPSAGGEKTASRVAGSVWNCCKNPKINKMYHTP
jgi:RHS repeat-associated protein